MKKRLHINFPSQNFRVCKKQLLLSLVFPFPDKLYTGNSFYEKISIIPKLWEVFPHSSVCRGCAGCNKFPTPLARAGIRGCSKSHKGLFSWEIYLMIWWGSKMRCDGQSNSRWQWTILSPPSGSADLLLVGSAAAAALSKRCM